MFSPVIDCLRCRQPLCALPINIVWANYTHRVYIIYIRVPTYMMMTRAPFWLRRRVFGWRRRRRKGGRTTVRKWAKRETADWLVELYSTASWVVWFCSQWTPLRRENIRARRQTASTAIATRTKPPAIRFGCTWNVSTILWLLLLLILLMNFDFYR